LIKIEAGRESRIRFVRYVTLRQWLIGSRRYEAVYSLHFQASEFPRRVDVENTMLPRNFRHSHAQWGSVQWHCGQRL